jgi:hypothetical protein
MCDSSRYNRVGFTLLGNLHRDFRGRNPSLDSHTAARPRQLDPTSNNRHNPVFHGRLGRRGLRGLCFGGSSKGSRTKTLQNNHNQNNNHKPLKSGPEIIEAELFDRICRPRAKVLADLRAIFFFSFKSHHQRS